MNHRVAFYPPLVAMFPVLAVYSANVGLFPLSDLFRPALAALLVGFLCWLLASTATRSFEKGAAVASAFMVAVWMFGPATSRWELPEVYGWGIAAGLALAVALLMRKRTPPTQFLNRFASLLVVVAVATTATRAVRPSVERVAIPTATADRADVFFLLLDGYGRSDQLARVMRYDNSEFIRSLESRGFFVARKANSNYCQTALSVASTLNMEWIQQLVPKGTVNRLELTTLADRPRIVQDLRRLGYESIALGTGFPGFTFDGYDLVIDGPKGMTYFESVLLDMTPIHPPKGMVDSMYTGRQDALLNAFDALAGLGRPTAKPRFVFAHILAPHPPFVFDSNGTRVKPRGTFGFWDGSDYMTYVGDVETYRNGYVEQVQWLNRKVLEAIDRLPKDAILIIQGDHGSKLGLDQDVIEKTDLHEVFGILAAYRVPPNTRAKLSDETTPLNAMRTIYSDLTGKALPKVEDKAYFSPFNRPTEFVEVTERLKD